MGAVSGAVKATCGRVGFWYISDFSATKLVGLRRQRLFEQFLVGGDAYTSNGELKKKQVFQPSWSWSVPPQMHDQLLNSKEFEESGKCSLMVFVCLKQSSENLQPFWGNVACSKTIRGMP